MNAESSSATGQCVLLIPGSLRSGSYTTQLLRAAGRLVPDSYLVETADQVRALPHYDADLDGEGAIDVVVSTRAQLAAAAGLIISTPEYNGSMPGPLKNWIDWVTRPPRQHVLVGKPVAVLGGSGNAKGAMAAVSAVRTLLGLVGAVVVGEPVAVPEMSTAINADGSVTDEVNAQLGALVDALITAMTSPA